MANALIDSGGKVAAPTVPTFGPGTVSNSYGPVNTFPSSPLPVAFRGPTPPGYVAPTGSAPKPVTGISPNFSFGAPAPASPAAGTSSLEADPGVALAKALEHTGIGSLHSLLNAQQQQLITQFGDPALASMAGFGLDPQAGAFAQQNYLSGNADLAKIDHAKVLAHRAIINSLAARGLLRSGDLGYQEGESNLNYGNQQYDARQGVLQKLADLWRQYLSNESTLNNNVVSAYQNAANNPDSLNSYTSSSLLAPTNSVGSGILPRAGAPSIASAFKKYLSGVR